MVNIDVYPLMCTAERSPGKRLLAFCLESRRTEAHAVGMQGETSNGTEALQASPEQARAVEVPKHGHRWVKGQSGNPAGRAKYVLPDGRTVREHARAATPLALAFLQNVMSDEQAPLKVRVAAAIAIVRTGHADATAETLEGDDTPRVLFVDRLVPVVPTPGVITSPIQGYVATTGPQMPSTRELTGNDSDTPSRRHVVPGWDRA